MENERIYIHSEFKSKRFGLLKSNQWSYLSNDSDSHKKSIRDYCKEDILSMVNEWSLDQCWGHKKHESFTQDFSKQLDKNVKIIKTKN